jgi:GR25 family glycosyltransferase involved in LPS biosynthesis
MKHRMKHPSISASQLTSSALSSSPSHSRQTLTPTRLLHTPGHKKSSKISPPPASRKEIFRPEFEFDHKKWPTPGSVSILENPKTVIDQKIWPKELGPVMVVSIRGNRMDGFIQRMGVWMKHMSRFQCINGETINPQLWRRQGKATRILTPGQLGCYQSHVGIWAEIAKSPFDTVTVFEDDVNLTQVGSTAFLKAVSKGLGELASKNLKWDFLSWGHGPWALKKNQPIKGLQNWKSAGMCQGFFAYTIKKSLAQKLLQHAYPIQEAVDMYFYHRFSDRFRPSTYCLFPSAFFVIKGPSETSKMIRH